MSHIIEKMFSHLHDVNCMDRSEIEDWFNERTNERGELVIRIYIGGDIVSTERIFDVRDIMSRFDYWENKRFND